MYIVKRILISTLNHKKLILWSSKVTKYCSIRFFIKKFIHYYTLSEIYTCYGIKIHHFFYRV